MAETRTSRLQCSSLRRTETSADVNYVDNNRPTPLHLASDDRSFELVKLLIQHGADVNDRENENSTTSRLVLRHGPVEAVHPLLDSGTGTDAQNDKG